MRFRLKSFVAAALLAAAADAFAEQGARRPWSGTWSGDGATLGKCENGFVLFRDNGKGDDTVLGKATWSSAYCLNPETGIGSGVAEETAANGDEVRMQIEVTITWTSPTGGTWSETETAIGGTGRFVAATGSSHSSGTFTTSAPRTEGWNGTSVWQGTSTGTITY